MKNHNLDSYLPKECIDSLNTITKKIYEKETANDKKETLMKAIKIFRDKKLMDIMEGDERIFDINESLPKNHTSYKKISAISGLYFSEDDDKEQMQKLLGEEMDLENGFTIQADIDELRNVSLEKAEDTWVEIKNHIYSILDNIGSKEDEEIKEKTLNKASEIANEL